MTQRAKRTLFLILCLLLALPAAAYGHGGGRPQLFREPAGPYALSVWSLPEPLTTGEVNLVVLVTSNEEGTIDQYILDADVNLLIQRGFTRIETQATHDAATNNLFYETYFDLERGGTWNVDVRVDGPSGSGEASFAMEVLDEGGSSVNWILYGGIGVGVLVILGLIWQFLTEDEDEEA